MQAAILPFSAGWQWINDGIRLFRRQPMAMFFWSLITGLLISLTYIIPLFGQMALDRRHAVAHLHCAECLPQH